MKIVPLMIAGFVGLILGWLLGPDIDDMRDDVIARLDAQAPQIASLQSGLAGLDQRLTAMPDAGGAVQAIDQRLAALEAAIASQGDAIAARVGEQSNAAAAITQSGVDGVTTSLQEGFDRLSGEVQAITAGMTQMRDDLSAQAQQAATSPAEDEASQLAGEVGPTGAVLLPGQGAIFGGNRLDLIGLDADAGTATMTPQGGEEADIAEGATIELAPGCTVRLAGIASGAAYLAPEDCAEPAPAEPAPAQPAAAPGDAAAAPTPAAPQPQPEGSSEETNAAPAGQPAAQDAEPGSDVPAQGAQAVPNQQPGQASGDAGAQSQTDRPATQQDGTEPAQ